MDDSCDFKIGDTVWAKIKGYPWWPAYVTDLNLIPDVDEKDQQIIVNFIGDHSHAKLPPKMVSSFNANFPKNSANKSKSLQKAVKIAQKFNTAAISRSEVDEFNLQFAKKSAQSTPKKAQPSPTKDNSRPVSPKKRKQPESTCENTIDEVVREGKVKSRGKFVNIMKRQRTLWMYMYNNINRTQSAEVSKNDVIDSFNFLADLKLSARDLKSCNIYQVVKLFKDEFVESSDPKLRELTRLSSSLLLKWKHAMVRYDLQMAVGNEMVYTYANLVSALSERGLEKDRAEELSTELEQKARDEDPTMGKKYNKRIAKFIQKLRKINP